MELTKLTIPQLENYLMKWISEAEAKGNKWASSKSFYESFEDKKKPVLAICMDEYEGSNPQKEQKALASESYKTFVEGLGEARRNYYQAQVDYDMAKLKIDALRTVISARKEEIKQFKG